MPLTKREIESWVLRILDRIGHNEPIEDSAIELKSEWPDPKKAVRRIAGHANAARGEPILWLIGIDEKRGVLGASYSDLADWWSQVRAEFDSVEPTLTSMNIVWNGCCVTALQFDTNRSPYVVRNPEFGRSGAGPVEREVPWREGTSVRSATHNDLVLLMTPLRALPFCKLIGGMLILQLPKDADDYLWTFFMKVFISPEMGQRTVFLDSDCDAAIEWRSDSPTIIPKLTTDSCSGFVVHLAHGVSCEGPGVFRIKGQTRSPANNKALENDVNVSLKLRAIAAERPIVASTKFEKIKDRDVNCIGRWFQPGYELP
jgi:hypothetical protein